MYCEQREKNEILILDCFGIFDETDTEQFFFTLERIQKQSIRHIIMNLSPVYYLDQSALGLLSFAQQFVESQGVKISLISPLSSVRDVLIRENIHHAIPTYETMYDALHRPHSAYKECANKE